MKPEEDLIYGLTTDNGLCFISHVNICGTNMTKYKINALIFSDTNTHTHKINIYTQRRSWSKVAPSALGRLYCLPYSVLFNCTFMINLHV